MNQNCCQLCNAPVYQTCDITKYYILCYTCIKSNIIYSKTHCKKEFMLNDNDLKNIKMVRFNNNYNYYLYVDIEKIILNKYGSLANLRLLIKDNNVKQETKKIKSQNIQNIREKKLKEVLKHNKLEFRNHGNFYSYIHYGIPTLETIVMDELKKHKEKVERRQQLSNELSKLDIPLDETLKSCYEYIYNLTNKPLPVVIRNIEVEHFLKHETDYDILCKTYSSETAQEIALKKYVDTQKLPLNIETEYDKLSLEFK